MKLLVALVNLLSPDAIYIDLAVDGLDKAQDCWDKVRSTTTASGKNSQTLSIVDLEGDSFDCVVTKLLSARPEDLCVGVFAFPVNFLFIDRLDALQILNKYDSFTRSMINKLTDLLSIFLDIMCRVGNFGLKRLDSIWLTVA